MLTATPERTPAVRRRYGSALTRERILTASMHLFSKEGFPRTTVRDIARQAGISDAAIYYHFAAKEDLLREIVNAQFQPDQWPVGEAPYANIRELVHEAVRGATQVIEQNHEVLRIILRESLAGDPIACCRYSQLLDDWESRLSSRLLPFESTGALAAGEAKTVARQIMYAVIMAFEDMLLLRPDPSLHPAERRLQAMVFLSRHIDRLLSTSQAARTRPAS